jgi:hypothetical protein
MMITKPFVVLGCLLFAASLCVMAQTTTAPQVRNGVIPNKTLPGAIDRNVISQSKPNVIVKTIEVKFPIGSFPTAYYSVTFEGLAMGVDIKAASGGVVVGPTSGPTINNLKFGTSKQCLTSAIGCSEMPGLRPVSKYYVRAFYTISEGKVTGTFYGNELSFNTPAPQPSIK